MYERALPLHKQILATGKNILGAAHIVVTIRIDLFMVRQKQLTPHEDVHTDSNRTDSHVVKAALGKFYWRDFWDNLEHFGTCFDIRSFSCLFKHFLDNLL